MFETSSTVPHRTFFYFYFYFYFFCRGGWFPAHGLLKQPVFQDTRWTWHVEKGNHRDFKDRQSEKALRSIIPLSSGVPCLERLLSTVTQEAEPHTTAHIYYTCLTKTAVICFLYAIQNFFLKKRIEWTRKSVHSLWVKTSTIEKVCHTVNATLK